MNIYKKAMLLTSFHPHPWNHRIVGAGEDPDLPGPSPWTRVLTVTAPRKGLLPAIKGSQPFLACCKYFAASNYSLFQSSTLQKTGYSQGRESNWEFQHLQLPSGVLLEFSSPQGTMTSSLIVPQGAGFGLKPCPKKRNTSSSLRKS